MKLGLDQYVIELIPNTRRSRPARPSSSRNLQLRIWATCIQLCNWDRQLKGQLKIMEHDFPKSIGRPATDALLAAGYTRLEQLASLKENDIKQLHGVGPKAIKVLRAALAEKGLSFADDR